MTITIIKTDLNPCNINILVKTRSLYLYNQNMRKLVHLFLHQNTKVYTG